MASQVFQELGQLITDGMAELNVSGFAVGVLHHGQEESAGWGITSVENPLPVTDETLFQIGSVTKTFTATAAVRLVAAGKLKLDEPLRVYLPDLKLADEEVGKRVTMRHLLTHAGGWMGSCYDDFGNGDDALSRMTERLADMPQLTPLDEVWHYNNIGFYVAGHVLAMIEGKPYETVIKEQIFEPLGMETSCFFPDEVMTRRFAVGHEMDENKQPAICCPWGIPRAHYPAGGIVSTAKDMLRYARFCLGEIDGVLPADMLAQMHTPQLTIRPNHSSMGLAWFIEPVNGLPVMLHGGGTDGQHSLFFFVPQAHLAAVVLTNSDPGNELIDRVYRWILLHYAGVEKKEPNLFERRDEELLPYVSHYLHPMGDLEVTLHEGGLMLHLEPRNFPADDAPPPPAPPPVHLSFFDADCAVVPDGPFKGMEAEFLQGADGCIRWVRLGNVIYKREG